IEKWLIDKRFIFLGISITIPCFPSLFLVLFIKVSRHHIPIEITSLHSFSNIFVIADEGKELGCSGSWFIIIVYEVNFTCTAICRSGTPIVHDIIAKIQFTTVKSVTVQTSSQTPVSAVAMRQQVVMETAHLPTDTCSKPVHLSFIIFTVTSRIQCFGY